MKRFILTVTFLICMSLNGANALENNPASKFGIAISNDAEKLHIALTGVAKHH